MSALQFVADALDQASRSRVSCSPRTHEIDEYMWEVRVDGVTHLRTNRALSAKRWIKAVREKQPHAVITLNGVDVSERVKHSA